MLDIPTQLKSRYARLLERSNIPPHSHNYYMKWLRFYLDFCNKYHHDPARHGSSPLFIRKLQEKNQTPRQQSQASYAIRLYYELKNTDTHIKSHRIEKFSPRSKPVNQNNEARQKSSIGAVGRTSHTGLAQPKKKSHGQASMTIWMRP